MTEGGRTVALLGVGLMGGSLARALRAGRGTARIVAWTPDGRDPAAALRAGAIDAVSDGAQEAVAGADLIVLAAPVGASIDLMQTIAPAVGADAVVTDVCSVKAPLIRAAGEAGLAGRFVGAHPMCGSEHDGWQASRPDLYRGARVYIVPGEPGRTALTEAFWRRVGGVPQAIEADAHDALVARASHVPQIVASALGAALDGAGVARSELGPGGRDVTRLAGSPAPLWTDILRHNRAPVQAALAELRTELATVARALEQEDDAALEVLLARAQAWAERGA